MLLFILVGSNIVQAMERSALDPVIQAKNRDLIHLCKNESAFSIIPAVWRKSVAKLLAEGANIDCLSEGDDYHYDGVFTPLSFAARFGQYEKCKILLELGADVNASHARITPLAAVLHPYGGVDQKKNLQLMMDRGADLNIKSQQTGKTPLMHLIEEHAAVQRHSSRWFKYLMVQDVLKMGADPLVADHEGNNALFHAAATWVSHINFMTETWVSDINPMTESTLVVILKFLVWRKYREIQSFITFLCYAKRMKLHAPNPNDRYIGEALYQNRKRVFAYYSQNFPSLRMVLDLRNNAGKTAYEVFCEYQNNKIGALIYPKPDFFELLNPADAEHTERILHDSIRLKEV